MTSFRPPPLPEIRTRPPRGRVLVVAPHPDDESAGPGGTLRLHALQGDPVKVVFVCSGIQGDPGGKYDRSTYASLRRAEAEAAASELGIGSLEFWGYVDNLSDADYDIFEGLPPDPDDKRRALIAGLAARLRNAIREFRPDIVYAPWTGEIHPDHWASAMAVEEIRRLEDDDIRRIAFLGYETWSASLPDTVVDTTSVHDAKIRALQCYRSQLAYTDLPAVMTGLNVYRGSLLPKGARHGEGFTGRYGIPPA